MDFLKNWMVRSRQAIAIRYTEHNAHCVPLHRAEKRLRPIQDLQEESLRLVILMLPESQTLLRV